MFADNVAKLMRSDFAMISSLHFWTFYAEKRPHDTSGRVGSGRDETTRDMSNQVEFELKGQ